MKNKSKNLKLYPKYRQLSMDFLFFYTINVLFFVQIKHINMSAVVLVETFYALFVVMLQIPATIMVGKIGRKKGIIFGNLSNAIYLFLVIISNNFQGLLIAEFMCALGFALKDISEPAILNESIELKKEEKSNIFGKIQSKAVSGHYSLSAISMIISGFLFEINGYIPIILCLTIVLITLILSTRFEEIDDESKESQVEQVSLKESIKFSFESKRCRVLLIFSGVFYGILSVLATVEISLLEELKISSKYIGIIFAFLNIVSAYASKRQDYFHNKYRNKSLSVIGLLLTLSCICSGVAVLLDMNILITLLIIIFMYILKYITVGLYNVLLIKYLSNFTNSLIDTKIFAINSFISSSLSVGFGVFASRLVDAYSTAKTMVIFGTISLIIMIGVFKYMKNKVGLDPKNYSKLELKYDSKV